MHGHETNKNFLSLLLNVKIFKSATLLIYAAAVISLAVATFLSPAVYGSVWFIVLWILFVSVLAASMWISKMWRHMGSFLLHLSFFAMLGGGMLTWLTSEKGYVRIITNQEASVFMSDKGEERPLPSPISLENFEIVYYPGGYMPRDYVSHLVVEGEKRMVSMNNILYLKGYRFCQSSYDNEGATVLSVNYDPYGITLSYAGYILFALGGLLVMLSSRGRFRTMLRSLGIAMILICGCGDGTASTIAGVPIATADSLKRNPVVYNGRIVTFNTLARDVVTKLYGKPSYRGLTPEQTLLSLRLFPDRWKNEPLLKVKDKELCKKLGIKGKYASLSDLFDASGNYRVSGLYEACGDRKHRAIEELDEKVGIVLSLYSGDLIVSAEEGSLPAWKSSLEIIYNAIPFSTLIFILLFCAFFISVAALLGWRYGKLAAVVILSSAVIVSLCSFCLQWMLCERLPLANTYETLQFVVLVMEVLTLLMFWSNKLLFPLSCLFAGALAFVAHLVEVNPVVTPLMPVLHSPWLSLHVSLVMTAYSLLCLTFAVSMAAVIRPGNGERLMKLNMCMLYPAVWLLGTGIFTGAVWANVSWGEYWSWDPKETWALVTLLVYALPLHKGVFFKFRNAGHNCRGFHIYMISAILSVAMTYFGVNYLNSMHAYN